MGDLGGDGHRPPCPSFPSRWTLDARPSSPSRWIPIPGIEAEHGEKLEKKERDGCNLHFVPVYFDSYRSVKLYFVKDVSVKDNSTHFETIYTIG
jgi:hypothetical protein